MKKIPLIIILLGITVITIKLSQKYKKQVSVIKKNEVPANKRNEENIIGIRLNNHVNNIKVFTEKKVKFNKDIAFLIDMKINSGKNRFFVYDLKKNMIIDKGLVAHGSGSETKQPGQLLFSNVKSSNCSSIGKYSIGVSYSGKFGKAYKLYGLDSTNSNASIRDIVLHNYYAVPYLEQASEICNSKGCPMVNKNFFERLEKIIDNSNKSILLEIYY